MRSQSEDPTILGHPVLTVVDLAVRVAGLNIWSLSYEPSPRSSSTEFVITVKRPATGRTFSLI